MDEEILNELGGNATGRLIENTFLGITAIMPRGLTVA